MVLAAVGVNGPEGGLLDWDAVDWRTCEENVRRLRQRIFTASRDGDLKRVRSLQKLMLRSLSNTLLSVRQVTQHNAGRRTAGVDGETVLDSPARAELAARIHRPQQPWRTLPVRRVWIPKARNRAKLRPLGIPVIADRAQQARVRHALEPEWEARFEPRSYGFRPGRGCQDAIQMLFVTLRGRNAKRGGLWTRTWRRRSTRSGTTELLAALGGLPRHGDDPGVAEGRGTRSGHGHRDRGGHPSRRGDQPAAAERRPARAGGGRRSPVRHHRQACRGDVAGLSGVGQIRRRPRRPVSHQEQASRGQGTACRVAATQGSCLQRGQDDDRPRTSGFDFLGFTIRRYPNGKLLITPSKAAIRRIRRRLASRGAIVVVGQDRSRAIRAQPDRAWLGGVLPRRGVQTGIHRHWTRYLWKLTWRWARRRHPKKPKHWIVDQYYGRFNRGRQDRWVFGDRDGGLFLQQVRLDPNRPTRDGQRCGVHRRPHPDRLLGRPAAQETATARPRHPASAPTTAGPMPSMRALPPARRPRARSPEQWEQWLTATRESDHPANP